MTRPDSHEAVPALLPCPFCNASSDRLVCGVEGDGTENGDSYFNVGCEGCDCRTAWFDTRASSHEAWNRRSDRSARTARPDVEAISRAIDPLAWASDGPTPTRGDTEQWHARRQLANAAAARVIAALSHPSPTEPEAEERIREDERDRLLARAQTDMIAGTAPLAMQASDAFSWLLKRGAMDYVERVRLRAGERS